MKINCCLIIVLSLAFYTATTPDLFGINPSELREIKLPTNPYNEILKLWHSRTEIISLGQERLAKNEVMHIRSIMTRYGISNTPEISVALFREINERRGELTQEESLFLAKAALKISPDVPAFRFMAARQYLSLKTLRFKDGLNELTTGVSLYFKTIGNRIRFFINLAYWTLLALAIALIVFILVGSLKYLPLLKHLVSHLAPKIFSNFAAWLIILTVPLLGFLMLGPLSLIFIFAIYFWLFFNNSEKLITVFILLFVIALPLFLHLLVFPLRFSESPERTLLKLNTTANYQSAFDEFSKLVEKNDDVETKFALSLIAKRSGNLSGAAKILKDVINQKPGWDKPYLNLANIEFITGHTDSAISKYSKAVSLNSSNFLANYNLGKVYFKQTKFDEANSRLKKATGIDPSQFNKLESISNPRDPVLYVFDEPLSYEDLKPRIDKLKKSSGAFRNDLWERSALINATPHTTSLIGILTILLLIVLSKSSRTIAPPRICSICGKPFCKKCSKIIDRRSTCAQCYLVFITRDSIDPNFKIKKETEEKHNKLKTAIFKDIVSFLIPGFGHIYTGSSLLGIFIVFFFGLFLFRLLFPGGVLANPYFVSLKQSALPTVIFIALLMIIYTFTHLSLRKVK